MELQLIGVTITSLTVLSTFVTLTVQSHLPWSNKVEMGSFQANLVNGAPYVMDFFHIKCVCRYPWEKKNLRIWDRNSVSFSRSGNLKFKGGSATKMCHSTNVHLQGVIFSELDHPWLWKLLPRVFCLFVCLFFGFFVCLLLLLLLFFFFCCRFQVWKNQVHSCFHFKKLWGCQIEIKCIWTILWGVTAQKPKIILLSNVHIFTDCSQWEVLSMETMKKPVWCCLAALYHFNKQNLNIFSP